MHIEYTPQDEIRFWSKVDKSGGQDACWLWLGKPLADGYGCFRLRGYNRKAHRMSYLLTYGELPDNLFVCHRCDQRNCVNPAHLFLGTGQDNVDDSVKKKRHTHGEKQGLHKLTWEQVFEIRRLWAGGGITQQALADRFEIYQTGISKIVNYKEWKD